MMVRLLLVLSLLALPFQAALAQGGMVSAADPRAAEAGREMLREGGSAVDAALAMMLALTVVEPQSSGIGGGGFLVHHDARNGRVTRSEEHTSELQSLMRISYAVFCLKKKINITNKRDISRARETK